MKLTYLLQALALTFCATVYGVDASSQSSTTAEKAASNLEPLHDEIDKTDIYAIPLDVSEMDEDADKELQNERKQ